MSGINFGEINWWAVLVAAFAVFMLGGLWYTALFGKLWVRLNGYSEEKVKEMQAKRPPPVFFGIMMGSYLLLAVVVALLMTDFHTNSAGQGAMLGFLLWLGPAVAIGLTGFIASDKPFGVFLIDGSYQLIFLVMMGAILGGWR